MKSSTPIKKRVLIVDDERFFLKACDRFLSEDYIVYLCSSGKSAVNLLKEGSDFAAIFLDVEIPDLSGQKIYTYICENRKELKDKVVFITAGVLDMETQNFLDDCPNIILEKPFDLDNIVKEIERLS